MRKRLWPRMPALFVVLVLSGGLLTACGQAPTSEPVSAHAAAAPVTVTSEPIPEGKAKPAWQPEHAAPGEVVYAADGLRSRPAPMDAAPSLSRADALAVVAENSVDFEAAGFLPGTPDVELRLLSNGDFGPDSPVPADQLFTDRLVWVVTFHDSRPDIKGPPSYSEEARAQYAATATCDFTIMLDAHEGNILLNEQHCEPKGA